MDKQVKVAALSEEIKANLLSGDHELIKQGSLAAGEYFRTEIRENGIRRHITPPTQVDDSMLTPTEDHDFPTLLVEIAGTSAGARKVSFETGPSNEVIQGLKTRVEFNRIMTPKYSIDKIRLQGYKMPLLDILYDLMLKDIMDCEDKVTIAVDNEILGTCNEVRDDIGCRRYVNAGPIGRQSLVHAKKSMIYTKGRLQPAKYLISYPTYCDLGVLSREEIGGDAAQDMFFNGVTTTKIQGIDTVVTTKLDIVPDQCMYIYTDPKYYGGFYIYNDVSMISDQQDDIFLSFFAHETVGASVVNQAGVARVDFKGALCSWDNDIAAPETAAAADKAGDSAAKDQTTP